MTVAAVPSGTRAKLNRVRLQLRTFDSLLQTFRAEHPYRLEVSTNEDQTTHYVRIYGAAEVSAEAGVIVGEILYHLRSSLDHMVHSLVIANGMCASSQTEFPVFASSDEFRRRGNSKIRGVSASAQTAIEALQPYHAADPFTDEGTQLRAVRADDLFVLNELARIDRHRFVAVVRAFIVMKYPVLKPGLDRPTHGGGTSAVVRDGLLIYHCSYRAPTSADDVEYPLAVREVLDGEWDEQFQIESEGGIPSALDRLTRLTNRVESVVNDLAGLL